MKKFLFALLIAFTAGSALFGVDFGQLKFEATDAVNAVTTPQLFQVALEKVVQLHEESLNAGKYEDFQDFWKKTFQYSLKIKRLLLMNG